MTTLISSGFLVGSFKSSEGGRYLGSACPAAQALIASCQRFLPSVETGSNSAKTKYSLPSKFFCTRQSRVGSAPFIKNSLFFGKSRQGKPPPKASIIKAVTLSGLENSSEDLPDKISPIMLCQIGVAPVTPEAICGFIGELSLLPTQTPTTYEGE